jgi:uncharacterized protein with HEPN domain
MTEREKKYLSDIVYSIDLIGSFISETKTFTDYQKDLKTKGAVERHLAIIGEAVNKFLKESQVNQLSSAYQIISLRNRLVHSYDSIDDSIVWSIITRYLYPLKAEVLKMMDDV